MATNGFFKIDDPQVDILAGYEIHPSWWSRKYEYRWAFSFVKPGMVVADMGSGSNQRPFKNMLATKAKLVYAVDANNEAKLLQTDESNINTIIGNFEEEIAEIKQHSLDRIFCISVLEEGVDIKKALNEFARLIKPDGLILLTFDVIADPSKPPSVYKGVNIEEFTRAVNESGLEIVGDLDLSPSEVLVNNDFNLRVFHCILKLREESFNNKVSNDDKSALTLKWLKSIHPKTGGVLSWPGDISNPEVTGYIIPTLLARGEEKMAKELADWVVSMQHISGGFRGQDGILRSFDTAACIEGLLAAYNQFAEKKYEEAAIRAKQWIVDKCMGLDGKIFTEPGGSELRDYSIRINGLLGIKPVWFLSKKHEWPFEKPNERAHYIGYTLEGLVALGEVEWVKTILEEVEIALSHGKLITYSISQNWAPARPHYPCHVASAQIGLLLTKLRIKEDLAQSLYNNLLELIDADGGIPVHPRGLKTSWTAKWFLDFDHALKTK